MLEILQINIQAGVILIVSLIFSLCFHEFSHAYAAYRLGDNTAAYQGRLTLNPLAHLDLFGSLMLLLVGFGYAKPVPVNPMNLSNPRTDMMKIAFAGPASNLFLCFIGCIAMRIIGIEGLMEIVNNRPETSMYWSLNNELFVTPNSLGLILITFSFINMVLAIFNLIPLYPLDGGQIFGGFLDKINPQLSYNLKSNGPKILLAIIFIGLLVPSLSIIGIIIKPFTGLINILANINIESIKAAIPELLNLSNL